VGVLAVRFHHIFLSPTVVLTIPPRALLDQNILVAIILGVVGLAGMLTGKRLLSLTASLSILSLLIWGKAATNILNTGAPDTAALMAEFTIVLLLTEASLVVLTFTKEYDVMNARDDELSRVLSRSLEAWLRNQLANQSRLASVALGLSIGLVPIAGLTSISSDQLIVSATLALLAVVVLMFLVIHRRESETG
jgi:hypothetical protein